MELVPIRTYESNKSIFNLIETLYKNIKYINVGDYESIRKGDIQIMSKAILKYERIAVKLNFVNKLIISHIWINQCDASGRFHLISHILDNQLYYQHDGWYTKKSHTEYSPYTVNLFDDDVNYEIMSSVTNYVVTYKFGIYINKLGYAKCVGIKFSVNSNKIEVQTLDRQFFVDVADTYIHFTGCHFVPTHPKQLLPFIVAHPLDLYNCTNLNINAFMRLHENIPYHTFECTAKHKKEKYLASPEIYTSRILDTYRINCLDDQIYKIKPVLFGHLVCDKSVLCNVDTNLLRSGNCDADITMANLQIFFNYVVQNKIPKLYELIENKLVEDILKLHNLCDYLNIQIYVDYFDIIIGHTDFGQLFDK